MELCRIILPKLESICFLKLSCDSRFQRAFTACCCVFKVIALARANQGNHFDNANTCSKRMLKTIVATQLKVVQNCLTIFMNDPIEKIGRKLVQIEWRSPIMEITTSKHEFGIFNKKEVILIILRMAFTISQNLRHFFRCGIYFQCLSNVSYTFLQN